MRNRGVFFPRAGILRAPSLCGPSLRALSLRMFSLFVCSLLIVALTLAAIPSTAFAQVGGHTIEAYGNEFEIKTPEDWATGDLDGGKLVVDDLTCGGAIRLSAGQTEATYTSAEIDMGTFEYLVMSWNADCPEGSWIEVTASVWLDADQQWSKYLTWGQWGPFVKRASHAKYPSSEPVNIAMDEFYVVGDPAAGDTASKIRLKVILHRDNPAIESPVLWYLHGTVRTSGVEPTKVFRDGLGEIDDYTCEVDVPQYSQMVRSPNISGVMCSATTGAMMINSVSQMEGAPLNVLPEEYAMGCLDFRALSFGNWSFTMAAAGSYGYQSYVDYSTIEGIKRHLKSGYAVGASVAYSTDPTAPNYLENAYGSTPGHLIVLRGFTVVGGVEYFISNDPYNPSNATVRKLYRVDQFQNVWSRNAIYVVKPGKVQGVGNHPVQRVQADLEEVEPGSYGLRLDAFGASTPIVTPKTSSTYSSRHGFIAYITEPEVFVGANPSTYKYVNVATNSSDLLTLADEILDDPDFRLYVSNTDAHTGKLFIVDRDSDIKPLVRATVSSTDYTVTGDEISPNEKDIVFGETPVQEFLSGLRPARLATMKLFASGTVVEDAADFDSADAKTTGTLAEGDFLAVLAWDGVTLNKYSIKAGGSLLPLNLSFAQDSVGLYHIDFPFTNVLNGYQGNGVMTWTSSNTAIARVDANGRVTPYNVGNDVVITVSVESDGVYQAATASYKVSVLRGTIESFHWGTIVPPKVGDVPHRVYIPSPDDQPDLFFFAANEPLFTWTGALENGKFKAGEAYSVSIRLQSNDYPGGNSAYFYANPFTADMIHGLPKVGDSTGCGAVVTGVTVTRNNNYRLTVEIDYSPLEPPVSVSRYAIVALDGDLSMAGNSSTASDPSAPAEGDVYAAGSIILQGNALVGGDATAVGSVTRSGNAKVAGALTESLSEPVWFAAPDLDAYLAESYADQPDVDALKAQAQADEEKKVAGDYAAPNGAVLGTNGSYSWIDGNLTIGGNNGVTLDGVLLVSGSVTLSGNAKLQGAGVIISESAGVIISENSGVIASGGAGAGPAVKIEGNARLTQSGGDIVVIATEGGVKVSGNAAIVAKVRAAGDIDVSGNGSVLTIGPMHSAGNLIVTGNTQVALGGTAWFEGSVEMSGNSVLRGAGTIVAEGNTALSGNASSKPSGEVPLVVSVAGNVDISGNGWLGARVYASNGGVRFSGNAKLYGSVAGKNVTLSGNNQVIYPVSLRD
ncbi:MAG: C39 family peptidase [Bacillota bacterium]